MAETIRLMKTNGKTGYNQDEWAVDTVDDLDKILKSRTSDMGSIALVIETGQVFMLNSK